MQFNARLMNNRPNTLRSRSKQAGPARRQRPDPWPWLSPPHASMPPSGWGICRPDTTGVPTVCAITTCLPLVSSHRAEIPLLTKGPLTQGSKLFQLWPTSARGGGKGRGFQPLCQGGQEYNTHKSQRDKMAPGFFCQPRTQEGGLGSDLPAICPSPLWGL